MVKHLRFKAILAAFLALSVVPSMAAMAQVIPGCLPRQVTNPTRTVYECGGGLVIDAETAAKLGVAGQGGAGVAPSELNLDGGAALFELKPGSGKNFQIRTPHAIASVRGTIYVVDVTADKTAVFVVEGRVQVTRPTGRSGVTLGPGEGTEVTPGKTLRSGRWSKARADALLARFGR